MLSRDCSRMCSWLFAACLVCALPISGGMAQILIPNTATSRSKNAVLYYLHAASMKNHATTRPLVAYVGANDKPRDWMFDTIIIDDKWIEKSDRYSPDASGVNHFQKVLFDDGELSAL